MSYRCRERRKYPTEGSKRWPSHGHRRLTSYYTTASLTLKLRELRAEALSSAGVYPASRRYYEEDADAKRS